MPRRKICKKKGENSRKREFSAEKEKRQRY